jgi:hypothetical protein
MSKKIILSIFTGLVIAGGSFYGGIAYEKTKAAPQSAQGRFGQLPGGQNGQRGMRTGTSSNFITGTILNKDASTLTIQLRDASSSKIVLYSSATPIMKTASGTPSNLTPNESVTVTGTQNADGSMSASFIQIRPADSTGSGF